MTTRLVSIQTGEAIDRLVARVPRQEICHRYQSTSKACGKVAQKLAGYLPNSRLPQVEDPVKEHVGDGYEAQAVHETPGDAQGDWIVGWLRGSQYR